LDAEALQAMAEAAAALCGETEAEVAGQGVAPGDIASVVNAHIRYAGTDSDLEIPAAFSAHPRASGDPGAEGTELAALDSGLRGNERSLAAGEAEALLA